MMEGWDELNIGRPREEDHVITNAEELFPEYKGRIVPNILMVISDGEVKKGDDRPLTPSPENYDFAAQYHWDFNKYKSIITDAFRVNEQEFRYYLLERFKNSPFSWYIAYYEFVKGYGDKEIPASISEDYTTNTNKPKLKQQQVALLLYYNRIKVDDPRYLSDAPIIKLSNKYDHVSASSPYQIYEKHKALKDGGSQITGVSNKKLQAKYIEGILSFITDDGGKVEATEHLSALKKIIKAQ